MRLAISPQGTPSGAPRAVACSPAGSLPSSSYNIRYNEYCQEVYRDIREAPEQPS